VIDTDYGPCGLGDGDLRPALVRGRPPPPCGEPRAHPVGQPEGVVRDL